MSAPCDPSLYTCWDDNTSQYVCVSPTYVRPDPVKGGPYPSRNIGFALIPTVTVCNQNLFSSANTSQPNS